MLVCRLSREKYKNTLSGYGASLNGQRWNSKGTEVVYTADSRALANSEVAVHIALSLLPKDYFMLEILIPDNLKVKKLNLKNLPKNWNAIPHIPETQLVGDAFVNENKFAVLRVPSVVVKGDFNYVLNPKHPDFSEIKIIDDAPFPFDPRFFKV